MNRRVLLIPVLAVIAIAGVAYAVQVSVNNVGSVGGTGLVPVSSGVSGDQIDAVWFLVDSNLDVDTVRVVWTPEAPGNYLVGVVLYQGSTPIATGTATVTAPDTSQKTTDVSIRPIDPSQFDGIEIIIIEQQS